MFILLIMNPVKNTKCMKATNQSTTGIILFTGIMYHRESSLS